MRQSTTLLTKRRRPISGLQLSNCTWECCGLVLCPVCRRFPLFLYFFNPAVLDTVSVHLMAVCAHVSRVRSLYKRMLVLHRFLPIELRALGDQYVKDEFRRHKSAGPKEVKSFMTEWEVRRVTAVKPAAARLLLHYISDITVQVPTVFFICRFSPFYFIVQ